VEIDPENWDEYYDAWASLDQLYDTFTNKLCLKTIEALFSSDKISEQDVAPRLALGMAKALYRIRGKPPRGLVLMLKMQVARILRQPTYFQIVCDLNAEKAQILELKSTRDQLRLVAQNGVLALGVGTSNLIARLIYDVLFPDGVAILE